MKYFCLNKISNKALKTLQEPDKTVDVVESADAVLVRSYAMADYELPQNIIAVARAGAGVNNIPLNKYADCGVVVFNTPGANANAVKELVLGGLMLASRDVFGGVEFVKKNKDNKDIAKLVEKEKSKFAGNEVINKNIGIIGLGVIGVLVANMCVELGMNVYGYDPYLSITNAMRLSKEIKYVEKLDKIFEKCEYISLHLPLNKNTDKMINEESFKQMKKGTVLLNFSRDSLVDEDALIEALESNKIKKYVTDFPTYKTVNCSNVITIPHLGASTEEAEDNCALMAIKQLKKYYDQGTIRNSVNYPDCEVGPLTADYRITICHKNKPGMINQFTDKIVEKEANIDHLTNKSKGDYAYSVFDIEGSYDDDLVKAITNISGVLKVRVIK